ncbi:MAG: hypothetical protein GQ527_10200 [Bacteroidales bacterium]|nr:hypothetical protein [Bacteroidales bacterium]
MKLEIIVKPKSTKYLEFSQSLVFIKSDLKKLCESIVITEENRVFSIFLAMESTKQLMEILNSTEIRILSGAIKMLQEKSEIIIHRDGIQKTVSDLKSVADII